MYLRRSIDRSIDASFRACVQHDVPDKMAAVDERVGPWAAMCTVLEGCGNAKVVATLEGTYSSQAAPFDSKVSRHASHMQAACSMCQRSTQYKHVRT